MEDMQANITQTIVQYMGNASVQENIYNTLKDRAPQFIASVAALANSNPKIAACEKKTVLSSCLIAASLDLPINQNLGFAYIIPYNVKVKDGVDENGKELFHYENQAQFQMGWKGFVQLAIRTGKYKAVNVREVREGEFMGEDFLSGEITFKWAEDREKLKIVGYVAYFKLLTGFEKMLYMTVEQLQSHGKKYSKSYKYGQWSDDPDAMMRKTVIKLLISKFGPMSAYLAKAMESDQAVVKEDKVSYVDNQPIDAKEMANQKEIDRLKKFIENAKTMEDLAKCEAAVNSITDPTDTLVEAYFEKSRLLEKGQ